jgi:hypothetical protein
MLAPNYPCFSCLARSGQHCTPLCSNISRRFGRIGAPKPEEFKPPVITAETRKVVLNSLYGRFGK